MTPLEFLISVKNSAAKTGIEEVRAQIQSIQQQTTSMYDGPARESKIRTEIGGIVKDVSLGKDPVYVFISALERMSEVFRFASLGAAALAIGFGLQQQLRAAAGASNEFFDLFEKGMGVSVKNASENALKELVKNMDELEEKYKARGLFERLLFGGTQDKAMAQAREIEGEAKARIDALEAARINAHTRALQTMTDADLAQQGEIDAAVSDLQQKAAAEREAGNEAAAEAYEAQMSVAVDRIKEKEEKADAERFKARQELIDKLDKANEENRDAGLSPKEKIAALYAKRAGIQDWIAQDQSANPLTDKDDRRLKAQIEVAELTKEIDAERAQLTKAAADATEKAADKELEAAKSIEQKKRETLKAQFENLSKEDKITVLKAEQARLEGEISRTGVYTNEARLGMQKDLAGVAKDLAELRRKQNPWEHLDAGTALASTAAYGFRSAVRNEAADRAEQQRDKMLSYLQTIAAKGDVGELGAY